MEDAVMCSCVQDIARSFPRFTNSRQEESELYQTSLMSALIDGGLRRRHDDQAVAYAWRFLTRNVQ
jgi:hypothetical protein